MATGNPALLDHIRGAIRRDGPVSFAWFMEQALYHPAHGYYSSGRAALGREGDYFTSVSVGPLFGRFMTAQFAEMWEAFGRPNEFTLVEQGAHRGDFARDVREAARAHYPNFSRALRYLTVEWQDSIEKLERFQGVHFSNELLDSFPVHLVKWTGAEWLERHVTLCGDGFQFLDRPLSHPRLAERVSKISLPLPAGYTTEVSLAALRWIDTVASKLERGFVLAIDYGFPRADFYAPHRTAGTLQSYARHQALPDPLQNVGAADLTAHVEWTSLIEQAQAAGLTLAGFTDQHHFITGLLSGPLAAEFEEHADAKTKRALHTLSHPAFLGMKFQILVLARGAPVSLQLSGLRFRRDITEEPF